MVIVTCTKQLLPRHKFQPKSEIREKKKKGRETAQMLKSNKLAIHSNKTQA